MAVANTATTAQLAMVGRDGEGRAPIFVYLQM